MKGRAKVHSVSVSVDTEKETHFTSQTSILRRPFAIANQPLDEL